MKPDPPIATKKGVLAGRVALITGAARGIGRACAELMSEAGAAVIIADRLQTEARMAVRAIRGAGGRAAIVRVDLSQTRGIRRMVDAAVRTFGEIDILVNNVGILHETSIEELTEEQWDRLMAVNLKAAVFVAKAVLRQMVRHRRGAVVNVSSLAGRVGGIAAGVDYSASKAGLLGVTRTLARQYGPYGIRVNAVAPGPIETDMTRHWSPGLRKRFINQIPLRRLGKPEDVARAVRFLVSPEADYITGITLDVNGGLYMG